MLSFTAIAKPSGTGFRARVASVKNRCHQKGEYAGTIQARDEAEALQRARELDAETEHERARIAVRREE